jgi:hypothetical protein
MKSVMVTESDLRLKEITRLVLIGYQQISARDYKNPFFIFEVDHISFFLFVCNHIVFSHLVAMTNSLIPSPLVNTPA